MKMSKPPHLMFRQWLRDGSVAQDGNTFIRVTKSSKAVNSFIWHIEHFGGRVTAQTEGDGGFVVIATLPDKAIAKVTPASTWGGHGGKKPLPPGKRKVQYGARFKPQTLVQAKALAAKWGLDKINLVIERAIGEAAEREGVQ